MQTPPTLSVCGRRYTQEEGGQSAHAQYPWWERSAHAQCAVRSGEKYARTAAHTVDHNRRTSAIGLAFHGGHKRHVRRRNTKEKDVRPLMRSPIDRNGPRMRSVACVPATSVPEPQHTQCFAFLGGRKRHIRRRRRPEMTQIIIMFAFQVQETRANHWF